MESLKQYRTKVKVLEEHKKKVHDDYQKAATVYSEVTNKVDKDLKEIHENLDTLLVGEAEKLFALPTREKIMFKGLYLRDPKAAVDWLKTKFHISKSAIYPSTVKRVKKAIGYSAKEGTDFRDFTLAKHESFKKMMRELYLTSVDKKPKGNTEHYGVEIECFVPSQDGVREEFQTYCIANRVKGAHIKSDSSIQPDVTKHVGIEITVLVAKDNISDLEKVCEWLKLKKAKVNKSCGLHVHLDFRSKNNIEECGTRLYNALPYLSRLVPETRRNNDQYCSMGKNSVDGGSRYMAINLQAYKKFKTLEVRLHSGTCNFGKIVSWTMILDNIINNTAFNVVQADTSIDRFVTLLDFKNDTLNQYIYERYKKFNGEKSIKEEKGEE